MHKSNGLISIEKLYNFPSEIVIYPFGKGQLKFNKKHPISYAKWRVDFIQQTFKYPLGIKDTWVDVHFAARLIEAISSFFNDNSCKIKVETEREYALQEYKTILCEKFATMKVKDDYDRIIEELIPAIVRFRSNTIYLYTENCYSVAPYSDSILYSLCFPYEKIDNEACLIQYIYKYLNKWCVNIL